jgi:hypothetical protein
VGWLPQIKSCRIADGSIVSEDILRRWKEHFEELLGDVEVEDDK